MSIKYVLFFLLALQSIRNFYARQTVPAPLKRAGIALFRIQSENSKERFLTGEYLRYRISQ